MQTDWGCKRFADRNNRNRNTKGPCCKGRGGDDTGPENKDENKCANRCCDGSRAGESPAGIMFWVDAPVWDNTLYAVRSGKGKRMDDPTMYYPGEIREIFVHVLHRDAKFTGMMMQAVALDHANKTVGEWVFPKGESNPQYWSVCPCPSLVHPTSFRHPMSSFHVSSTQCSNECARARVCVNVCAVS